MLKKINKHYVSPIDQKLDEFNSSHPRTASQKAEIEKYERIFNLRDEPVTEPSPSQLWENF